METKKQKVRHADKMARRRLPDTPTVVTFEFSRADAITLAVHCEQKIIDLEERLAAFEKDRRDARRRGETWRAGGVMMEMYLTAKFHVQDTIDVLRSVCDQYETASGRKIR